MISVMMTGATAFRFLLVAQPMEPAPPTTPSTIILVDFQPAKNNSDRNVFEEFVHSFV